MKVIAKYSYDTHDSDNWSSSSEDTGTIEFNIETIQELIPKLNEWFEEEFFSVNEEIRKELNYEIENLVFEENKALILCIDYNVIGYFSEDRTLRIDITTSHS